MRGFGAIFVWRQNKADYSGGPVVTTANQFALNHWNSTRPQVDTGLKLLICPPPKRRICLSHHTGLSIDVRSNFHSSHLAVRYTDQ